MKTSSCTVDQQRHGLCRLALSCLLAALCGIAAAAEPERTVSIAGDVKRPVSVGVEALRNFASTGQLTYKSSRDVEGRQQHSVVKGVSLRALLEQAGLAERDRLDWRKSVVIVTARDGYRVVFSWPELFNTEAGGQVMLVYERDGAPLGSSEGPIGLSAPGDIRTGPRHVKWLERIEVKVLRD